MRDLIKKVLRENSHISPDAPHWVKTFHDLPTEGRIAQIEKNKKDTERILPRIVEFFKDKFGDDLLKLKVGETGVHYGNENYSTKKIKLTFYFPESYSNLTKREIFNDLKSFFNIDLRYYGTPLEIEVYRMKWESL